jgi:putative aldouronate transport system permease protein
MNTEKYAALEGVAKFNRIKPLTNVLFNLLFIVLALIAVVPVLFVLAISLTEREAIQQFGYQLIPSKFSLEGYAYLAKNSSMLVRTLLNSVQVTVLGVGVGVILTALMGYVLSRKEYRLNKFMMWVVFIPMIFNGGIVAQYVVNSQLLGLKNNLWALILPMCMSSFNVIVAKTFFRMTIPDALIESAKIDGATQFRIFFRLVLPLSAPVLATIALFVTFVLWNDWFQSLLYIDGARTDLYTLQYFLNQLLANLKMLAQVAATGGASVAEELANMPGESARMAVSMIIVIPIACAYPFFQRYFISGLTVGAVKG